MKGTTAFANLATSILAGNNGVVSALSGVAACQGQANGAGAGGSGAALVNYELPALGNFLCTPLAVSELKSFQAKAERKNVILYWTMTDISSISAYEIQRSIDQVSYRSVVQVRNSGQFQVTVSDTLTFSGSIFYRLKLIRKNGSIAYSQVVLVSKPLDNVIDLVRVFPNPAKQSIHITVVGSKALTVGVMIYNGAGQQILIQKFRIARGQNTLSIPVSSLAPGIYWLMLDGEGMNERRKFIRTN